MNNSKFFVKVYVVSSFIHFTHSIEISGFLYHFRFYVKSTFWIAILRGVNFVDLVNFGLKKDSKWVKMADFALQESSK